MDMMGISKRCMELIALATIIPVAIAGPGSAAGIAESGHAVAVAWCSSCHVVSDDQKTASADVPTFRFIAKKYGDDVEVLAGFLANPHPPMPKLNLTRNEILDIIAYIASLR